MEGKSYRLGLIVVSLLAIVIAAPMSEILPIRNRTKTAVSLLCSFRSGKETSSATDSKDNIVTFAAESLPTY